MSIFPKVVIVGNPNVGKSTLFNRMVQKKAAIVTDVPGTTRDFNSCNVTFADYHFTVIDTAGWELLRGDVIKSQMRSSTEQALGDADIVMFVVDGRCELSAADTELAGVVLRSSKKALLIVNKSEAGFKLDTNELYKLGFGEPIFISAEHKLGFQELYLGLIEKIEQFHSLHGINISNEMQEECIEQDELLLSAKAVSSEDKLLQSSEPEKPKAEYSKEQQLRYDKKMPRFALVGRPNVGKSTLFNKIIGARRSIVSEVAGTTRDIVSHDIAFDGKIITLLDTAGLRKQNKIDETVEELSIEKTKEAISKSCVLCLVVSAPQMFESQDIAIAQLIIDAGKGLVLIVNKCDLIKDLNSLREETQFHVKKYISSVHDIPIIFTSGLNSSKPICNEILQKVLETFSKWNSRFSTWQLNKWLKQAIQIHTPSRASSGRSIRLKYITQTRTCPPTFALFTNYPNDIDGQYVRYLSNSFAKHFHLSGTPIKLLFKKTSNPYVKNSH